MQLRVRKHSGRLIGPIEVSEFYKLYSSGLIHDLDQCQVYPDGTWRKVEDYKGVDIDEDDGSDSVFDQLRKSHDVPPEVEPMEDVQVMDISKLRDAGDEIDDVDIPDDVIPEAQTLDKTDIIHTSPEQIPDENTELDATVVANAPEEIDSGDRTLVNVDTKQYLEELKKQQEEDARQKAIADKVAAIEEEKRQAEENLTSDATTVINLNDLQDELRENLDLNQIEAQMEREEKMSEEEREKNLMALLEEADEWEYEDEDEEEEEEEEKAGKRKKRIYMFLAVVVLYLMLAEEEGVKKKSKKIVKVNPLNPTIEYPIENEVINAKKSDELYKKGLNLYNKFTYSSLLKASGYFLQSLEHKRENNPALFPLLVSYTYMLENSVNKFKDANTIFKLLRLVKTKVYLKQDVAVAFALFYRNIGKYHAALDVLKKYDKVRNSLETGKENYKDIFFYLISDLYVKLGKYDEVKVFYKNYTPNASKRAVFLSSFIEYDLKQARKKEALKLINKGLKLDPHNVPMHLYAAEYYGVEEKYKKMKEHLDSARQLNVGGSNELYDKYLFLSGKYFYKTQKFKEANESLRKVFRDERNLAYRKEIAKFTMEGGDDEFITLINESKAELFIAETERYMELLDWNSALTQALNASELIDDYLPAKINLAKVQINQGFFDKALKLLQKYYKSYPEDKRVVFNLVDAYIESYKLHSAKQVLLNAANTKLRDNPLYDKLSAKLNMRIGDRLQAVRWLQESINSNPIDDENYFNLAKLLIKLNKHNKARAIISSAIELAPDKVEYRLANAEIIYEQSDPETAIGYLRQQLDEFPGDPQIEGQIAILYYKSGQIKNFEESIKELEQKFKRADKLYNFLIESALLDHRLKDVVKYAKQLVKVKPGDLKTRMLLVETLIELKSYKDAHSNLLAIEERLPDYPKLLYYKSTIELVQGNTTEAKKLAEEEVKKNPGLVDGYILLGNILKTEGDFYRAEDMFKKAQKLVPSSAAAIAGMAYINFKKHQLESAIDLYNKAINLDQTNAELRRELGDVYRQNGQNIDAITQYEIYLELEPDTKYKLEIQTYIRQFK